MSLKFNLFNILIGNENDSDYKNKPVIIQGMTGSFGSTHTKLMKDYSTNIVAGVTPGKGGQSFEDIPVFNTVAEAVRNNSVEISGVFVPAPFFLNAAKEAIDNGIKLLVAVPEHVPIRDSIKILEYAEKRGARMIGPNTPGVIVPEIMKVGIMPAKPFTQGSTVVFSRSGTLMYEVSYTLSNTGYGQRICLEIGGDAEEKLADYIISTNFSKPVVAYVAGRAAPKEKKMGHAGAIVYGNYGSADSKVSNYSKANVPVAKRPGEVPELLKS